MIKIDSIAGECTLVTSNMSREGRGALCKSVDSDIAPSMGAHGDLVNYCAESGCVLCALVDEHIVRGGEGGIRTHGDDERHNGFRDRPIRPLWHLSGTPEL